MQIVSTTRFAAGSVTAFGPGLADLRA